MSHPKRAAQLSGRDLVAMVWRHAPSKYQGSALVILLKIAGLSKNTDGHVYAFPGTDYLARSCGLKRRYLQEMIQELKADGILRAEARHRRSNHFSIRVDRLRALPQVDPGEPTELAISIAEAIHRAIVKEIPGASPDEEWQRRWPVAIQTLLDTCDKDAVLKAARAALESDVYRVEFAKHGAVTLLENFEAITEQLQ